MAEPFVIAVVEVFYIGSSDMLVRVTGTAGQVKLHPNLTVVGRIALSELASEHGASVHYYGFVSLIGFLEKFAKFDLFFKKYLEELAELLTIVTLKH